MLIGKNVPVHVVIHRLSKNSNERRHYMHSTKDLISFLKSCGSMWWTFKLYRQQVRLKRRRTDQERLLARLKSDRSCTKTKHSSKRWRTYEEPLSKHGHRRAQNKRARGWSCEAPPPESKWIWYTHPRKKFGYTRPPVTAKYGWPGRSVIGVSEFILSSLVLQARLISN